MFHSVTLKVQIDSILPPNEPSCQVAWGQNGVWIALTAAGQAF